MSKYKFLKDATFKEVEHKESEVIEMEESEATSLVADGTLELIVE